MDPIKKIHEILTKANTKKADGYEAWQVTWYARYGSFSDERKPVSKVFLNEEDAKLFVESLKMAADILQYTESIRIKLTKI